MTARATKTWCCLLLILSSWLCAGPLLAQPAARTITDYKDQLGLTDAQTQRIARAVTVYQNQLKESQARLSQAEGELSQLLEAHAPLDKIRQQLEKSENIRMQVQLQDVETSRQVRAILTNQQWAQWQTIKQGKAKKPK